MTGRVGGSPLSGAGGTDTLSGFETLAATVEHNSGIAFADYLAEKRRVAKLHGVDKSTARYAAGSSVRGLIANDAGIGKERTSSPAKGSSRGSSRCSPSITVTAEPSDDQACASSTPETLIFPGALRWPRHY